MTGSAHGLFDVTTTPMQEMESNTRKLQQSLVPLGEKLAEIANTILPPLVSVIQTVSGWFAQLPGPVQNFIVILGALLARSEEHTSELQSRFALVCRLLLAQNER